MLKNRKIQKALSFFLAIAFVAALFPVSPVLAASQTETQSEVSQIDIQTENEVETYIVAVKDGTALQKAEQKIEADVIDENEILTEKNMLVAELTAKEIKALEKDPSVLFVEENFIIKANSIDESSANEDNSVDSEWNMQAINADNIQSLPENVERIKVAALDSGSDIVPGINLAGMINLVPNEKGISPIFTDLSGHGTAVCSIIGSSQQNDVRGVNPNAALYSVKALDANNRAPVSRIIEGIYW